MSIIELLKQKKICLARMKKETYCSNSSKFQVGFSIWCKSELIIDTENVRLATKMNFLIDTGSLKNLEVGAKFPFALLFLLAVDSDFEVKMNMISGSLPTRF